MNNSQQSKEKQEQQNQEVVTIMPSMIDNEEMTASESRRDLSAIIPQYKNLDNENGDSLESRDSILKSDGAVVLGTFNLENSTIINGVQLPDSIDIDERKAEIIRNKKQKKKETKKKTKKKTDSKSQNVMSIVSLIVIGGLVLFWFYYKNVPKDSDFKPLHVYVELGQKLPIRMDQYVKPGIGNTVNEMAYKLDTSSVIIDKIGDYEFSITHNNITKKGVITVEDKTSPDLEIRQVIIQEGDKFDANQFVSYCNDLSGCNYSFEELNTENKYTTPGTHTVYIAAVDAYNNKTVKQASLIILKYGSQKIFVKYENNANVNITYKYEMIFGDANDPNSLLYEGKITNIYTYLTDEAYQYAKKEYLGLINWECDDKTKTITYSAAVDDLFNTYSNVVEELADRGYRELYY